MRSASKIWALSLVYLLVLSCGSTKPQPNAYEPMQKAYVLIKSEGSVDEITQLKNILNSDFVTNNIASKIVNFPLSSNWNSNQIFSTAYNENYDYIILIDQVAKFTIDKRTQVGGKYQIRSYHVKSTNPDWLDLGQLTCNVTVKPSIQKFTSQIVSQIVPNYKPSSISYNEEEEYVSNSIDADEDILKSSEELDDRIQELQNQLKLEREKTKKALEEKERLEKLYEEELALEKQKNKLALANLETLKKESAAVKASEKVAEADLNRQKEIAQAYAAKREEIKKREAEEALKNPKPVVTSTKEPTREEVLKQRQEAKQRIIEERAIKRKKQEEEAAKRMEDRKRLVQNKKEEQKRRREELDKKRREQKLLAKTKKHENLAVIKKETNSQKIEVNDDPQLENEKESITILTLNKQETNQTENLKKNPIEEKRLADLKKEEERKRLEEKKLEEEETLAKAKLEQQKKLDKQNALLQKKIKEEKLKEEKRLADLKKEEERKQLEAKKLEEQRIAKKKKEEEILAKAKLEQQKILDKQNAMLQKKIKEEKLKEEKRLADLKKEEERIANTKKEELLLTSLKLKEKKEKKVEEDQIDQEVKVIDPDKEEKEIVVDKPPIKKLTKEEKRLEQDKREAEEFERKKQLREEKRLSKKNTERNQTKKKSKTKNVNIDAKKKDNKPNILLVIRGNLEDKENLKKLQENLAIEILFKKAKSTSIILDKEKEFNQQEIINQDKSSYKLVIIINQLDYIGDGVFNYKVSTFDYINSSWNNYDPEPFNLSKRNSLKLFTKKVVNKL